MFSGVNKRAYSGWLKKHQPEEFKSDLKLQKFLFFYESISETENGNGDFNSLKGYEKGPVFSNVFGDYQHERYDFIKSVEQIYETTPEHVDERKARLAGFLVSIMNEAELSSLTHEFNIWKAKEQEIKKGVRQVPLSKQDFNENDKELVTTFRTMYTDEYINSVVVYPVYGKNFIIQRDEYERLTDEQFEVLMILANQEELVNPVYVSIDEDGVILVD